VREWHHRPEEAGLRPDSPGNPDGDTVTSHPAGFKEKNTFIT
jgi:hypothetical protein